MGVDNNARGDAERVSEHDVGGLARHSGKREEFVHLVWHASDILLADHLARPLERFRFVAKESRRTDVGLQLEAGSVYVVLGAAILAKEISGYYVDAFVRALG